MDIRLNGHESEPHKDCCPWKEVSIKFRMALHLLKTINMINSLIFYNIDTVCLALFYVLISRVSENLDKVMPAPTPQAL